MRIWRALLLTACFVAGCKLAEPKRTSQHSVLDQQFSRADVQLWVQEAERDLAGDKWVTAISGARATKLTGTWNQTRRDREVNLADKLLKEIQPQFRQKSVPDLLASLKTYPWSSDMLLTGVASYYFDNGNRMIIEEIRKRPATELNSLRQHVNDKRKLYQENGPYSSVGMLCEVLLDAEEKAVR